MIRFELADDQPGAAYIVAASYHGRAVSFKIEAQGPADALLTAERRAKRIFAQALGGASAMVYWPQKSHLSVRPARG